MSQNGQPLTADELEKLFEDLRPGLKNLISGYLRLERFEQICKAVIKQDPNLLRCTKKSLGAAIKEAAILGLEPGVKGSGHLLAFNSKVKAQNGQPEHYIKECQFQIGYKGYITMAYRSGQVLSIAAEEVKEKDHFLYMKGITENLEHMPAMGIRGETIAYYAYARLKGGAFSFTVMSLEEMKAHAYQYTKQQYNGQLSGTWKKNFDGMAKKTVITELLKYLPQNFDQIPAAAIKEPDEQTDPMSAEREPENDSRAFLQQNTERLQQRAAQKQRNII